MRGLILALQFLTRLPTPRPNEARDDDLARAAVWFPAVGLILGGLIAGAVWLGAQFDPWLGALAGLAAWVLLTGALHLDGLADLADALGAAHGDRERLLSVLADPHLGAFGAVALVMQLLAKLVLLMLVVKAGAIWSLVLVPAWARLGPLLWARLPPLKAGLGARFALRVDGWRAAFWGLILAAASCAAPVLLLAPFLMLAWHGYLKRRLGGMSGDALGAGVEWLETALLLALVIAV